MWELTKELIATYAQELNLEESHLTNDFDQKKWSDDINNDREINYPIVIINDWWNYKVENNQKEIDLRNEVKANVNFDITVLSNEINDIIAIEENIYSKFKDGVVCISDKRYLNKARVFVEKDKKPERTSVDSINVFQSIISFEINDLIIPKYVENPVKIELDKTVQRKIMNHLALLNETYNALSEDYEREALLEQIKEMYTFEDTFSYKMSAQNNEFTEIRKRVIFDKVDIKGAIESYKEKAKEEKEFEDIYGVTGDSETNRFTDVIVKKLQDALNPELDIDIYGGSTLMRGVGAYGKNEKDNLIIVWDNIKLNWDYKKYINKNCTGLDVEHAYESAIILPVDYKVKIALYCKDKDKREDLAPKIKEKIKIGLLSSLEIEDPQNNGERQLVKITSFKENKLFKENNDYPHWFEIETSKVQTVYYYKEPEQSDLMNNQRLQLNIIEIARAFMKRSRNIDDTLWELGSYYKPLIDKKKELLGFLNTKEYKELKKKYIKGENIEKGEFENVFDKIVKVYPNLYDAFQSQKPYEQIYEDIEKLSKFYKEQGIHVCELLRIPENAKEYGLNHKLRDEDSLEAYILEMEYSPYLTIDKTIKEYVEFLKEESRLSEEERVARGSDGGGILKTALGVGLGNVLSGNSNRGKPDLSGSVGCQLVKGGDCSITCKLWYECKRGDKSGFLGLF